MNPEDGTQNTSNSIHPPHVGPQSDADTLPAWVVDPGLAVVIGAWGELPTAVRAGIVAMVQASNPGKEGR